MRRRDFIIMLGGAAVGWSLAARAQQPAVPVIGFLSSLAPSDLTHVMPAFRQGLDQAGFVEGRNVTIEYRWAESDYVRLPVLAPRTAAPIRHRGCDRTHENRRPPRPLLSQGPLPATPRTPSSPQSATTYASASPGSGFCCASSWQRSHKPSRPGQYSNQLVNGRLVIF
jgi:hypothetical protein